MKLWLLLSLVLSIVLSAVAPAHALDRGAAVARAREIRAHISAGTTDGLWPQMTGAMQRALTDSASFSAMGGVIRAQLGSIDSVLDEEVIEKDSLVTLRSRCRMSKLPTPVNVIVSLDPAGRIAGMLVRPETSAPKEYPSAFLDYVPKTRFTLPFKGDWFCVWGGRTVAENYHAANKAQRFAHDLYMRRDGASHRGEGKALTDYHCYGQPLLAPADGVVVTVVDSLPDQAIGGRDPLHAAGNHVVIDHGNSEYSLLAHMQPRSLRVKPGQKVKRGDVLGLTGNSGNTSEPHLHVHLMNKPSMSDADGLPMPFTGYTADGAPVASGELKRGQTVAPAGKSK